VRSDEQLWRKGGVKVWRSVGEAARPILIFPRFVFVLLSSLLPSWPSPPIIDRRPLLFQHRLLPFHQLQDTS